MTNKVKPFYIRITDDMTPQIVQDAFDKCVDAGVVAGDKPKYSTSKYYYDMSYSIKDFDYLGVTNWQAVNTTRLYMNGRDFGSDAQEITLDQLDEWLGLESKVEWDGKGLPPVGVECEVYGALGVYSEWHKCEVFAIKHGLVFISDGDSWTQRPISEFKFRPVETPEQRAERERLEAAYDLYSDWCLHCEYAKFSFADFCGTVDDKNFWLSTVDKTNYRKQ